MHLPAIILHWAEIARGLGLRPFVFPGLLILPLIIVSVADWRITRKR